MPIDLPVGDLARCKTTELDDSWPVLIEVVAYFGEGRRKRRSISISQEQFFGRGNGYNAPMTGDQIIGLIERLRRQR